MQRNIYTEINSYFFEGCIRDDFIKQFWINVVGSSKFSLKPEFSFIFQVRI